MATIIRLDNHVPLERRADWLVLATLSGLRARLLFAGSVEAAQEAAQAVAREIARARDLQLMRAAASWLDARPQLGRDVFGRARTERDPRVASYMRRVEACLTVLQGRQAQLQSDEPVYQLVIPAMMRLPEAIARMRWMLATVDEPTRLEPFLPAGAEAAQGREAMLRRAGIAGAFLAALELAREEQATLEKAAIPHDHDYRSAPVRGYDVSPRVQLQSFEMLGIGIVTARLRPSRQASERRRPIRGRNRPPLLAGWKFATGSREWAQIGRESPRFKVACSDEVAIGLVEPCRFVWE